MNDKKIVYVPLRPNQNLNFLVERIQYYSDANNYMPKSIEEAIYINEITKYLQDINSSKIKCKSLTPQITQEFIKNFRSSINIFLNNLSEEVFTKWLEDEQRFYDTSQFLEMIEIYKFKKLINEGNINNFLKFSRFSLSKLLQKKWFLNKFKSHIKHFIIEEKMYTIFFNSLFDEGSENFLPQLNIDSDTLNSILDDYIDAEEAKLSNIELIYSASPRKYTISPKIKYKAKVKYHKYMEKVFSEKKSTLMEFGIKARFNPSLENLMEINTDGTFYIIEYNSHCNDYLKDLDILLNFLYYSDVFFTDIGTLRSSHKPKLRLTEFFETKGHKFLSIAENQRMSIMLGVTVIQILNDLLSKHSLNYLQLIKYFIDDVLPKEYSLYDLEFDIPETKNQKEINTLLVINLENLIKTYNYFVEYGEVEKDVIEIGYPTPKIENLKSQKYMYLTIKNKNHPLASLLFSGQSPLSYHPKFSNNLSESNFYSLVMNNNMTIEEWKEYEEIQLLFDEGIIYCNKNIIQLTNKAECGIWYLLYKMRSLNIYYFHNDLQNVFHKLIEKEYAELSKKLFTKDEAKIFSYLYNNETSSNGPSLRNKYAHSKSYSSYTDNELYQDYYTILYLYTIFIMKINDDCRLMNDN